MNMRKNPEASPTRDAVTWYLRHKYLQLLSDKVYSQKEIADAMGIPDTRLIYLKHDAKGAGFALLDAFARFYRTTPDVLVREALVWWEHGGEAESQVEQARMEHDREVERAAKRRGQRRPRRTDSSERPSVKLVVARSVNDDKKPGR